LFETHYSVVIAGFRDPRAAYMPMERGNRHTEEIDTDGQQPQKDYYVSCTLIYILYSHEVVISIAAEPLEAEAHTFF
jgi:hypothetical protein